MAVHATNSATGETLKSYQEMTPAALQEIVGKTHEFLSWRHTTFDHRAALMRKATEMLRRNAVEYAGLMAQEMG